MWFLQAFMQPEVCRLVNGGSLIWTASTSPLLSSAMSTQSSISWTSKSLRFAKDTLKYLWHRYRNLRPLGQAFIWCTVAFYIALGTFIIMLTPARIFQWLYDLAQRLSHLRLGWLALGGIIGMSQSALRSCAD